MAAPAISLTVRDVTGETTVHDGVRPAETDVETFRAAVAAARGTEPALLRLVRGDVPLDDGLRTLAKYGIMEDAELELVAQTAEEGKARRIGVLRHAERGRGGVDRGAAGLDRGGAAEAAQCRRLAQAPAVVRVVGGGGRHEGLDD